MLTIGKPTEWKEFEKRHRLFFERYGDLREAQNRAFIRPLHDPTRRNLLVFYTGRLAVEDFQEILLLAGNGNGVAALKILRGMYERTVDGRYLSTASDKEVENFYAWNYVQKHKLAEELQQTMGADFFDKLGYTEQLKQLKENYAGVRDRFLVHHCDHCKKTKVNFSWSEKSLIQRAAEGGEGIRGLTFESYYVPLEHAHSSIAAILHRLEETEDGSITFKDDVQRGEADLAMQYGFLLLINVLTLQYEYFNLENMKEPLDRCYAMYREIYLRENGSSPSGAA